MSFNRETKEDIITSADLPGLRADMIGYINNEMYSAAHRDSCREVVAAIDQARDEDESTHGPLKAALEKWVALGQTEVCLLEALLNTDAAGGIH